MDQFTADLKRAQKEADTMARQLRPLKTVLTEAGTAFTAVGGAALGGLLAATKAAANYGDELRDASIRTGFTTQALAGMKLAAEQSGTSFEELQVGLRRFAVVVNEAATNTKKGEQFQKQFGVSVTDTSGKIRPYTELLAVVQDKFHNMPDGIQKSALATDNFGKSASNLTEFLSLSSKEMTEFQQRAERLGLAIGPDFAREADRFNDQLKDMDAATKGLSVVIGAALIPLLTDLVVKVTNVITAIKDYAKEHPLIIERITKLAALIGAGGLLMLGIAGLITILPTLIKLWADLNLIMATNPFIAIATAIAAALTAMYLFRNEIAGGLTKAFAFLLDQIAVVIDGMYKLAQTAGMREFQAKLSGTSNDARLLAKDLNDMSAVFLAGEPMILDNTALLERYRQEHLKLPPVIKDTDDALVKLAKSFNDSLNPSAALNEELIKLSAMGFTKGDMIKVYAQRMVEAAEKTKMLGQEVVGMVAGWLQLAAAEAKAQDAYKTMATVAASAQKQVEAEVVAIQAQQFAAENAAKATDAYNEAMKNLPLTSAETSRQFETLLGLIDRVDASMRNSIATWKNLPLANPAGTRVAMPEITAIPESVIRDLPLKSWKEYERIGKETINSVADDIGQMFTDSIAHGKSFWEAFKNLGTDAFGAITSYFIKTSLKQMLTSSEGAIGRMVAEVQSALGGLGGLIVGGAGIVGSLIGSIGAGRREADRFVQTTQNPFGESVNQLFQALSQAKDMGTLTVQAVTDARSQLEEMWQEFGRAASEATHGVGQQAIAGLNPLMEQWREWLIGLEGAATDFGDAAKLAMENASGALTVYQELNGAIDNINGTMYEASHTAYILDQALSRFTNAQTDNLIYAVGDDVKRLVESLQALGEPIPAYVGALYQAATAQERLAAINKELGTTVRDAAYWQTQYDDAVKASADKLQSLTEQRKSLEKQIRDAEFNLEKSRLENVIATTSNIKTYYAAQKDLAALNTRIQDQSVMDQMQNIIDMDIQLNQVIEDQQAAADAYAHASAAAQDAIYAEKERIALLESERQRLTDFMNAADLAYASFQHVIDALRQFGLLNPITAGALPQYQFGTLAVPETQVALVHKGERITPAAQNQQGEPYPSGIAVNVHVHTASVVTDKQLVQHIQEETLRAIQQYGVRPQTRQKGVRSNRY